MPEVALKLQISLFFSLLAGNEDAETGSTTTASATTHFFVVRRDRGWANNAGRERFRTASTALN